MYKYLLVSMLLIAFSSCSQNFPPHSNIDPTQEMLGENKNIAGSCVYELGDIMYKEYDPENSKYFGQKSYEFLTTHGYRFFLTDNQEEYNKGDSVEGWFDCETGKLKSYTFNWDDL